MAAKKTTAQDLLGEDTTPTEDVDKTPKDEEEETPVDIDTSALKKEVTETVSKELVDKLNKTLVGEPVTEADTPWGKEGRNPKSWDEVANYMVEKSEKVREEKAKQTEKQQKEAADANVKAWNQIWDAEIHDLQEAGSIPKIEDKSNPNDPGIKAIQRLFEEATKMTTEGRLPTKSLKVAYYEVVSKMKQEPPGGNAPVFGQRTPTAPDKGPGYSYEELHNTSMDDILSGS